MLRSDFVWVNFDAQFNAGNTQAHRTFFINGNPIGENYLLIQGFDIERSNHRILINGNDLPSFDLPRQGGNNLWTTWMDRIPTGFLRPGRNRISIIRNANEAFFIANVAINWRERDGSSLQPIALGVIGSTGNRLDNVGIRSVVHGSTGEYTITLEDQFSGRPVVHVTPTIVDFDDPIPTYTIPQGDTDTIIVRFVNSNEEPRNAPFSLLVYDVPSTSIDIMDPILTQGPIPG